VAVVLGLTDAVPPLAASATLVPSVPVSITCVALLAVTTSFDEEPETIVPGVAVIVAVGGRAPVTVVPPQPDTRNAVSKTARKLKAVRGRVEGAKDDCMVFSLV
jgi:hypothetical protein